jgi:hypothetical protein
MGRGRSGHRLQGPGTITPCAAALAIVSNTIEITGNNNRSFTDLIISSLANSQKFNHLARTGVPGAAAALGWWSIERAKVQALAKPIELFYGRTALPPSVRKAYGFPTLGPSQKATPSSF